MTVIGNPQNILIGQTLFGEHIAHSAAARTGEMVGLLLMVVGVIRLAWAEVAAEPRTPVGTRS